MLPGHKGHNAEGFTKGSPDAILILRSPGNHSSINVSTLSTTEQSNLDTNTLSFQANMCILPYAIWCVRYCNIKFIIAIVQLFNHKVCLLQLKTI